MSCLLACLWAALSVDLPNYRDQHYQPEIAYRAAVGWSHLYLHGSYEQPGFSILGQRLGDMTILGYGAGYRYTYNRWSAFAEVGYYKPSLNPAANIEWEVVEEQLNQNHVCQPWQPFCNTYNGFAIFENTELSYTGEYGWRVGVDWAVLKHVAIGINYRALTLTEKLDAYTGEDRWQERNQLDASVLSLGVTFTL